MDKHDRKNGARSLMNSELSPAADLFGHAFEPEARAERPQKRFSALCAECGEDFEALRKRGRPIRFCSDECRRKHGSDQRRDWEASARSCPAVAASCCGQCGSLLPTRLGGPGRLRRFCSPRCFQRSRERVREQAPDMIDLLNSNTTSPSTR